MERRPQPEASHPKQKSRHSDKCVPHNEVSLRASGKDPFMEKPTIPSRPTGPPRIDVLSHNDNLSPPSRVSSSIQANRFKPRLTPTPQPSVPSTVKEETQQHQQLTQSDQWSVFRWARKEAWPTTVSTRKGRDDIDSDDLGAIPVLNTSSHGQNEKDNQIFRPIPSSPSLLLESQSSGSSDMYVEQGENCKNDDKNKKTETAIKNYRNNDDDHNLSKEDLEKDAFPWETTESHAHNNNNNNNNNNKPSDALTDEEKADTSEAGAIFVPVATLVETNTLPMEGQRGRKPFHERKVCWVLILLQVNIVAAAVVIVLMLRGEWDGDATSKSLANPPTYPPTNAPTGSQTRAPAMVSLTRGPSTLAPSTMAPTPFKASPPLATTEPTALLDLEFPDIEDTFRLSYKTTLAWFGSTNVERGHPYLQRFVLGWLWHYTTNNGADPWVDCNPANTTLGETDACTFYSNPVPSTSSSRRLCYTTKQTTTRWLSSQNECSWAGVSCDNATGIVTSVKLTGVGLKGSFPFFISRLTNLTELDLSFGSLNGTIPREMSRLPNLVRLDLSYNLLVDPIPDELFSLPIEYLKLGSNSFEGPIPGTIGKLSRIRQLDLTNNKFSKPLPENLRFPVSLELLQLSDNRFNGATIPASWGSLTNLREMSIFRSGLEGEIPESFSSMTKMTHFRLHSNNLVGSLPPMPWPSLLSLEVKANALTGTFPEEIYQHKVVQTVDLSYNQFSGSLKDAFSAASLLRELNLERNSFTGSLPASFQNLTNLNVIRLQVNMFTGSVPEGICNLRPTGPYRLRSGPSIVAADCLSSNGLAYNPCSCCTFCCDQSTGMCRSEDDPQTVRLVGNTFRRFCEASYRWDRFTGKISTG